MRVLRWCLKIVEKVIHELTSVQYAKLFYIYISTYLYFAEEIYLPSVAESIEHSSNVSVTKKSRPFCCVVIKV